MLGGLLSLLSAVTFAFNNASARRGVLTGSITQAMAITVPIGVPIFFAATAAAGALGTLAGFSARAIFLFAVSGVIHFVWGRYCNYRATKAMGANLVGPIQQVSLLLTLGLAITILGEALTPLRMIGIALVVLGPMLTLRGDPEKAARPATDQAETPPETNTIDSAGRVHPAPFEAKYTEGVIFAILSATGYGTSPILIRLALEQQGLGASLAGGLIANIAATIALLPMFFLAGRMRDVLAIGRESAKWFTISGVLVTVSQMFLYMAFAVAPVSVVSPIQRVSIIFRIYFGWLLNPRHEVFGGKVIWGTVVSLLGAVALSVSTDLVLSLIALPDWLVAFARWQWP